MWRCIMQALDRLCDKLSMLAVGPAAALPQAPRLFPPADEKRVVPSNIRVEVELFQLYEFFQKEYSPPLKRIFQYLFEKKLYEYKYYATSRDAFREVLAQNDECKQLHDNYFGQHEKLYAHLIVHECATTTEKRVAAHQEICEYIETPEFANTPLTGIIKPLLYRWVLMRFVEYTKQPKGWLQGLISAGIPPMQKTILAKLFDEFGSDPVENSFWLAHFGEAYITEAKALFLKT